MQKKSKQKALLRRIGGTESGKNAHHNIQGKPPRILLPSRFAAVKLSSLWQTVSRKSGLTVRRCLAPRKRLSLRLYRPALTAVLLVPYSAANRHSIYVFAFFIKIDNAYSLRDIF